MKSILFLLAVLWLCIPAFAQPGLEWARTVGGQLNDEATSVCVDNDGSVYFAGNFLTTMDADPGPGVYPLNSGTNKIRSYIIKLDSAGQFRWAYNFDFFIYDVHVDTATNRFYLAGSYTLTRDFDPGPGVYNLMANAAISAYVSCFDTAGTFQWASATSGGNATEGKSITTDPNGNVYVGGYFDGTSIDADPGSGTYYLNSQGMSDGLIWKLDHAGNFISATAIGGTASEYIFDFDIDPFGGFYILGQFAGTVDFNPGTGTHFQTSPGGYPSTFILKLHLATLSLNWVKFVTPPISKSLKADPAGNVYYTGFFTMTTDFDPGNGVYNLTPAFGQAVCVSKLDSAGGFAWAISSGLTASKSQLDVDASGNCYLAGALNGSGDFDPSSNVLNVSSNGQSDAFLCKINSTGHFLWVIAYGNAGLGCANDIALDPTGNFIHSVGYYENTADFDPGNGVTNLTATGAYESYVQKLGLCVGAESSLSPVSPNICTGSSTTIQTGGNLNSASYWGLFTGGCNGTLIDSSYGASFLVSPTTTTTYYIKGIGGCGSAGGCDSITVTVHTPSIGATPLLDSVCPGMPVTLNGTGGVSYSWDNGITDGVPFFPQTTATYTVIGTDANNCVDTAQAVILVHPGPQVTLAGFNPDTVCYNSPAVLLPLGNPAGGIYTGNGISGNTFDPLLSGPGNYPIIYTFINSYGCSDADTSFMYVAHCNYLDLEPGEKTSIQVFPNPAADYITLANLTGSNSIQLLDASGRIVARENTTEPVYTLYIPEALSGGIYTLWVISELSEAVVLKISILP